ncbi:MAG: helix-turn-helix domain-containing protein [Thermodesulfobacteriota bacterium]
MQERTTYKRLLGKRTRELRKARGLTQAVLAERLGVTQEYLGKIERGLAAPSFPLLVDLARTLETEPADLLRTPPLPEKRPAPDSAGLALRETRHRMRNCFQLLGNLVTLELERAPNENVRRVLRDLAARIRCLTLLDNALAGDESWRRLGRGERLRQVRESVSSLYPSPRVLAEHNAMPVLVPPHTVQACSLVLTEFLTNMYKHAFPGRDSGVFRLELSRQGGSVRLVLADDGVGLSPDPAAHPTGSMGLNLMRSYVEDSLGGAMRLENRGGTTLTVDFPLPAA